MQEAVKATMTVEETAQYIGIGRGKMYNLVKDGKIPYLKFGKSIRIPKRVIDDWLLKQCEITE